MDSCSAPAESGPQATADTPAAEDLSRQDFDQALASAPTTFSLAIPHDEPDHGTESTAKLKEIVLRMRCAPARSESCFAPSLSTVVVAALLVFGLANDAVDGLGAEMDRGATLEFQRDVGKLDSCSSGDVDIQHG